MIFVGPGTPEGDDKARRLNQKRWALDDQIKAYIRDFYLALPIEEKSDFRVFLSSYVRLRKNMKYLGRFVKLRDQLDVWVAKQPAHADVMQADTKSLPTVDQLVAVVNEIEPLD